VSDCIGSNIEGRSNGSSTRCETPNTTTRSSFPGSPQGTVEDLANEDRVALEDNAEGT
jgi:hypothetical protein